MNNYIDNNTTASTNEISKPLRVCWHCLLAIESREGSQSSKAIYVDETDPNESFCDWCKEDGFDLLYEI